MTPPAIVGIDLGKNWFHVVGLDEGGATILRKRLNRAQLAEYAATAPQCIVATESCPGSQYWGRVFTAAGHEVRILPAQFVKPYLKANKNDFNDAAAIAEAASRASMRYVPLKTTEQLELQALHHVRRRFIVERTAVINQMRALLLEHGMVIPVGRAAFVHRLPPVTEAEYRLSPRLVELLHRLRQRWLALDVEIVQATRDLAQWADQSPLCRRAATVPGIGPIIATAVVAAVGDGRMFASGRDMAAWLGLVPRQHSTGGKPTLGSISNRGNTYLRELFIQGAQSSFVYLKRDQSSLGQWLRQVETRRFADCGCRNQSRL
jgi:transposase